MDITTILYFSVQYLSIFFGEELLVYFHFSIYWEFDDRNCRSFDNFYIFNPGQWFKNLAHELEGFTHLAPLVLLHGEHFKNLFVNGDVYVTLSDSYSTRTASK